MPGRVKLTCEAGVDTLPAANKRRVSSIVRYPTAKRTKFPEDTPAEEQGTVTRITPQHIQNSPNPNTTSRLTSPRPDNGTSDNTPPSSQPAKATTKAKKKQVSKPRDKKYLCTHNGCDKSFTRPCRLEEHLRTHTGDRPYKCTYAAGNCDKSFLRNSHLKAHIKAIHSREKTYRCTFLIPPGKKEDRGEFGFKRKASEPTEGPEDDSSMKECGARFSTNQHLKRHVESHLKTFPYICRDYPPCSAGFRKKGPLTRHVRLEHLNLQPWACSHEDTEDPSKHCQAAFDTKGKLGNHVATQHNGLARRRYICTICVTVPAAADSAEQPTDTAIITYTNTVDLDQNTEDASLLLALCQQSFPVVQAPPGLQPSQETLRGEGMLGFSTHAELRAHITAAHPPICVHCGYVAKRQHDLHAHFSEKHGATVEERQTWICGWDGCGQGFTKKSNLTVHTRAVHEGLKPFLCTHLDCGKRFGHKAVLVRHIAARHTPNNSAKAARKAAAKRKARKKRTRALALAEKLTGVGYENSGRNIQCVVEGCEYRFCRTYDLEKHLSAASAHRFTEEQIGELMKVAAVGVEEGDGDDDDDDDDNYDEGTEESESEWSLAGSETEEERG